MRRREFFTLAGAAVMWPLWPLASVGQPKPLPVIGILDPDVTFVFDAFVEGMRDSAMSRAATSPMCARSCRGGRNNPVAHR